MDTSGQIRLLECERIWKKSAEYYREGRARAIRKREEEARGRRRAEIEARGREHEASEREKEKDLIRHGRTLRATCTSRAVLSYRAKPASNLRVQMSTSQSPPKDRDDGAAFEYHRRTEGRVCCQEIRADVIAAVAKSVEISK
ncbi:hypothetical protein PHLCEN_2v13130 [Hermanssonia centrifuga]|uniref:Uncharacterized protein n=1 Tax=Hermanssonia centrifuga TaxID=98765 RepID=A0A2R6NF24_9APHY|nr:hypothetical protein PHLCEN_2v13130 [Hermanssonia centrifuga]